ncbi:MAG TPA: CAP domain-containing protein [Chloroflexota bacterium]|nr:CAP domain-containing protein [Chloroflexota bacterium]
MSRLIPLITLVAGILIGAPLAQASSALLSYSLQWAPDGSLLIRAAGLQHNLQVGSRYTVQYRSSILTISLARAPQPVPNTVTTALLAAVNKDRAAHHAAPLTLSAQQSACSARHSSHMAQEGYISHDQFPGDVCVPYHLMAENVGVASGDPAAAVLWLQKDMMAEGPCPHHGCPRGEFEQHGHYLNLINPAYKQIGIGVVESGGETWLTEDFVG